MKLANCIVTPEKLIKNREVSVISEFLKSGAELDFGNSYAYAPLINSHDHLIGNWYPKAGNGKHYTNSDIWVEEMKKSDSFLERSNIWPPDGKFNLTEGNAYILTTLGVYKSIFSGCNAIQDHIKNQNDDYYESFPINVIKDYRQVHTMTMGNWWGGKSAKEEWMSAENKMPFILHLGEGIDENADSGFPMLLKSGLLKSNTLIIHGIILSTPEFRKISEAGASICWCPDSNMFLIGKTLDVEKALAENVNIVLGTDSTLSGSANIFDELKCARKLYPKLDAKEIYKMISTNASKALYLDSSYGNLVSDKIKNLLILKNNNENPFENVIESETHDVQFLMHQGKPVYGDIDYFEKFNLDESDYYFFRLGKTEKFVVGHPEKLTQKIDEILGFHKVLPFIPFT